MWDWIKDIWRKEWPIVKSAPCSFGFILFVGFVIGCVFMLFIYNNFILPDKDAHIELLQGQIDQLKVQKQSDSSGESSIKPVTKQEIRTFLESIHPDILKMVDAKQKVMHVLISIPKQIELLEISKRPNFDNFLSIKKSGKKCIGGGPEKGIIKEFGENGYMDGYYFYPKDALLK